MGRASALHYASAVALLLSPSPVAAADFETGNQLLSSCDTKISGEGLQCLAYLEGLIAGALFTGDPITKPDPLCLPDRVTMGQVRDVVVEYLRTKPAVRHFPGGLLALAALRNAFPCSQK